jgi:hypothetical protein
MNIMYLWPRQRKIPWTNTSIFCVFKKNWCNIERGETRLQLVHSVTQYTAFAKAFFTFRMSCGFTVHGEVYFIYSHKKSTALKLRRFSRKCQVFSSVVFLWVLYADFHPDRTVSVGTWDWK